MQMYLRNCYYRSSGKIVNNKTDTTFISIRNLTKEEKRKGKTAENNKVRIAYIITIIICKAPFFIPILVFFFVGWLSKI
jgi:hypothetical protein